MMFLRKSLSEGMRVLRLEQLTQQPEEITSLPRYISPFLPCAHDVAPDGTHTTFGVTQTAHFSFDRDARSTRPGPAAAL